MINVLLLGPERFDGARRPVGGEPCGRVYRFGSITGAGRRWYAGVAGCLGGGAGGGGGYGCGRGGYCWETGGYDCPGG
ncbi:MAG: hypothetical protein WBO08_03310 [Mycobacterium sp.]